MIRTFKGIAIFLSVTIYTADARQLSIPAPTIPAKETPAQKLTLDTVIKSALLSFPGLLASEQRKELAAGEQLAAEGGFDTTMKMLTRWSVAGLYENQNYDVSIEQPTGLWGATFFGGWRRGTGKYPVYEGKSMTASDGEFRGGVSVPLWRNGPIDRRRASLAQAELGKIIAGHEYDAALLEVRRVTSHRYWDWVLAGARRAVAQELLSVAERRDMGIRERAAAGDIAPIDTTDNQRSILERKERLIAADRMLEQSAIQLSLYYRDPDSEPRMPLKEQLPEGFPEPKYPELTDPHIAIEKARHLRPELNRLEKQLRQAEIEREWASNQQAPALDISLMGAQDLGTSTSNLVNREEVYAGISIELPLQRRVAKGRTQIASANVQRLTLDYRLFSDRIAAEVKDAISAIKAAEQRITVVRQQQKAASQLAEGERSRFELGDSTLFLVDTRELANGDAALAEAEALSAYFKAMADYRAALGILSE